MAANKPTSDSSKRVASTPPRPAIPRPLVRRSAPSIPPPSGGPASLPAPREATLTKPPRESLVNVDGESTRVGVPLLEIMGTRKPAKLAKTAPVPSSTLAPSPEPELLDSSALRSTTEPILRAAQPAPEVTAAPQPPPTEPASPRARDPRPVLPREDAYAVDSHVSSVPPPPGTLSGFGVPPPALSPTPVFSPPTAPSTPTPMAHTISSHKMLGHDDIDVPAAPRSDVGLTYQVYTQADLARPLPIRLPPPDYILQAEKPKASAFSIAAKICMVLVGICFVFGTAAAVITVTSDDDAKKPVTLAAPVTTTAAVLAVPAIPPPAPPPPVGAADAPAAPAMPAPPADSAIAVSARKPSAPKTRVAPPANGGTPAAVLKAPPGFKR